MMSSETQLWNLRLMRTVPNEDTNLNDVTSGGFFSGYNLGNAPTTDWYFCEIIIHAIESAAVGYILQRITRMTGSGTGTVFSRVKSNTSWTSWTQLN